jgi:hypothetical protein
LSNEQRAADRFYAHVIEHAIAYFGSRVLYPSRPAPVTDNAPLTRAGMEKIAQAARSAENIERAALEPGHRIGSQIYDAYLAGKLSPGGLRRLFLAHLDEPGLARKVCGAVLSKLKSASRPSASAAHA